MDRTTFEKRKARLKAFLGFRQMPLPELARLLGLKEQERVSYVRHNCFWMLASTDGQIDEIKRAMKLKLNGERDNG
jgi:hypothetical protein